MRKWLCIFLVFMFMFSFSQPALCSKNHELVIFTQNSDSTYNSVSGVVRDVAVDTPIVSEREYNTLLEELDLSIKGDQAVIKTKVGFAHNPIKKMNRPKILIIYTGGTIGMIQDMKTKALIPFDFSHIYDQVPRLSFYDIEIDTFAFDNPIDSSDMHPQDWKQIAEKIHKHYADYDGFVILHGTDTIAYTASALSFMFENLSKPIILTGSQLPLGIARTDGRNNIINAV